MAKKIIVIENDRNLVTVLGALFANNYFEVELATDGVHGFDIIKRMQPDLILMDINLINRTGLTLYRALKRDQELSGIPVFLLNGELQFKAAFNESLNHLPKPDAFWSRPFDNDELLAAVKEKLG